MSEKVKVRKAKVMKAHSELVRSGDFAAARKLFRLLDQGSVLLGLGDVSYKVECILEEIGCLLIYSSNFNTATAYIA